MANMLSRFIKTPIEFTIKLSDIVAIFALVISFLAYYQTISHYPNTSQLAGDWTCVSPCKYKGDTPDHSEAEKIVKYNDDMVRITAQNVLRQVDGKPTFINGEEVIGYYDSKRGTITVPQWGGVASISEDGKLLIWINNASGQLIHTPWSRNGK